MTATANWPETKAATRTETEADRSRHAERARIRDEAARASMLRDKVDALQQEINRLNRSVDEAADNHAEVTRPLQEELQRLEKLAVARIANREPSNEPTEDARRIELVRSIEQENARLESVSREIEPELQRLQAEKQRLSLEAAKLRDLNYLTSAKVANPELVIRRYGMLQLRENLQRFRASLDDKIAAGEHYDELIPGGTRGPRWRAAAQAADEQLAYVSAKLAELHEEIVNE